MLDNSRKAFEPGKDVVAAASRWKILSERKQTPRWYVAQTSGDLLHQLACRTCAGRKPTSTVYFESPLQALKRPEGAEEPVRTRPQPRAV